MNGKDCLLAFADVDASHVAAANDIETIRRGFNKQKKRRTKMIGAVCGCVVVLFAGAAFGSGRWFRQTPSVIPTEAGTADRPLTEPSSSDAPSTVPAALPQETQAPPTPAVPASEAERNQQTPSVPDETQNQPSQSPEPSSIASPAVDAATEAPEGAFEKSYRYSLNGSEYSFYIPGKVIAPDKVGEKIGDAAVTAGWKYADGTTPVTEQLRCEIYRVLDIDPATAICIRFIDKGEALTTDQYYVQYNASADLSAVSAYVIPAESSNGEE